MTPRGARGGLLWLALCVLAVTTLVAASGWFLAAREGRGIPPECYTLDGPYGIQFAPVHGNATRRAMFAVAESDNEVTLGYWEDVANGNHTDEGYPSLLTYTLTEPLGDRKVVDPSGEPISAC